MVYRPPHVNYTCLSSLFTAVFVDMAVFVDSVLCLGGLRATQKKAPWRNEEIIRLTVQKDKWRSMYNSLRHDSDWVEYENAINRLNQKI